MSEAKIKATKNGRFSTFTETAWSRMGVDKMGWERVVPMPKEVAQAMTEQPDTEKPRRRSRRSIEEVADPNSPDFLQADPESEE